MNEFSSAVRVPIVAPEHCGHRLCVKPGAASGYVPSVIDSETMVRANDEALGRVLTHMVRAMRGELELLDLTPGGDLYLFVPFSACPEHRNPGGSRD